MKKFILIAAIAAVAVSMTTIFYACQKEEVKTEEKTEIVTETLKAQRLVVVQISYKGFKGVGTGKDKNCVDGNGRCWLWFRAELDSGSEGWWIIGDSKAIVTKEGNIGNNRITLDFKYRYNDTRVLQELFDLRSNRFVIEENIIEEDDSILLELMETSSPCVIRAGVYPIIPYAEGIRVTLPVNY